MGHVITTGTAQTFTDEQKATFARMLAFAEKHPMRLATLDTRLQVRASDIPEQFTTIGKMKVCFSIDEQVTGWCRHISVAVPPKQAREGQILICELLRYFSFEPRDIRAHKEQINHEMHLHLLQPLTDEEKQRIKSI